MFLNFSRSAGVLISMTSVNFPVFRSFSPPACSPVQMEQ